jgi:hypothetical protein
MAKLLNKPGMFFGHVTQHSRPLNLHHDEDGAQE